MRVTIMLMEAATRTSSSAVPIFLEYKVETQVFDETGEPVMKDGKPVTEEKLIFAITNSMVVTWIVAWA